jgi:hypothetical protein
MWCKSCSCAHPNWAPRHEGALGKLRYSSTHSLTSALDGGEWSASRRHVVFPSGPSKKHSNIISPSTPRSSEWTFTFRFPDQNFCIYFSSFPSMLHVPSFSSPWFYYSNYIWSDIQVMKLIMQFFITSCHLNELCFWTFHRLVCAPR